MNNEEKREQFVQKIAELLRENAFTFTFKVKKKPEGIKIIWEVTQEQMDAITKKQLEENSKEETESTNQDDQ